MKYNRRKFLTFPKKQQHKKCAEILYRIYEEPSAELFKHYNEIQNWMDGDPLARIDPKTISDRYHKHLRQTKFHLREHGLLPNIRKKDGSSAKEEPWPIAIYLDRIRSAHNVGSILRTVEAFSLGRVYFSPETPCIDHNQVQKASMGTFEQVSCFRNASVADLLSPLIALETSGEAIPIHEFLFPEQFSLAIGNEEYGCSDEVLQKAGYLVEIPLRGRKNSLNVANAFAIAAAEIAKQKQITGKQSHGK